MTSEEITWPGIDKQRAQAAAWHLARSAELLRQHAARGGAVLSWRLRAAGENLRIAYGFLGAVGFERGGRPR